MVLSKKPPRYVGFLCSVKFQPSSSATFIHSLYHPHRVQILWAIYIYFPLMESNNQNKYHLICSCLPGHSLNSIKSHHFTVPLSHGGRLPQTLQRGPLLSSASGPISQKISPTITTHPWLHQPRPDPPFNVTMRKHASCHL